MYPTQVSGEWLEKYIKNVHYGRDNVDYSDTRLYVGKFVLLNLPIEKLNHFSPIDEEVLSTFSNNTQPPPIVVDQDLEVIDGVHRLEAAKRAGQKSIQSYVPLNLPVSSYVSIPLSRTAAPYTKVAISVPDLVKETNAFSVKRKPGCQAKLSSSTPKELFLQYNVTCHESYSDPSGHDVRVQFDVKKVEQTKKASDLDVKVSCSCPAFLMWGAQWNIHQRDGLLGNPRPELRAPTKRKDLRDNFVICKHLATVFQRILPSVQNNMNNILRDKEVKRNKQDQSTKPLSDREQRLRRREDDMRKRQEEKKIRDRKNKQIQKKLMDALRIRDKEQDENSVSRTDKAVEVVNSPKRDAEENHGLEGKFVEDQQTKQHHQIKDKPHVHTGLPYETEEEKEEHGHDVPTDQEMMDVLKKESRLKGNRFKKSLFSTLVGLSDYKDK